MKDSILTSIEFTNRLRSIYRLMDKNKQYKIELVYQKFQINNFSIEQIFKFTIAGFPLTSEWDGNILLTNYFSVNILPYNYLVKIMIDSIKVDVRESDFYELPYEYNFSPHCVHVINPDEISDEMLHDDINSIHRLTRSRRIYKYSLLHLNCSKLINLIDLVPIKCI